MRKFLFFVMCALALFSAIGCTTTKGYSTVEEPVYEEKWVLDKESYTEQNPLYTFMESLKGKTRVEVQTAVTSVYKNATVSDNGNTIVLSGSDLNNAAYTCLFDNGRMTAYSPNNIPPTISHKAVGHNEKVQTGTNSRQVPLKKYSWGKTAVLFGSILFPTFLAVPAESGTFLGDAGIGGKIGLAAA